MLPCPQTLLPSLFKNLPSSVFQAVLSTIPANLTAKCKNGASTVSSEWRCSRSGISTQTRSFRTTTISPFSTQRRASLANAAPPNAEASLAANRNEWLFPCQRHRRMLMKKKPSLAMLEGQERASVHLDRSPAIEGKRRLLIKSVPNHPKIKR